MSTKEIVELISVAISLLVPLTAFITAFVKIIREKQWNVLKSMLCEFMIKAEQSIQGSGEDKKNAVLKWCEQFCKQQGINFNVDQVSAAIETLIDLTKKVNTGKTQSASIAAEQADDKISTGA